MNDETILPQRKLRLLGNLLLVLATLGLVAGLGLFPLTLQLSEVEEPPVDPEIAEIVEMAEEAFLPEGLTLDTTLRDLLEHDREFIKAHRTWYHGVSFLSAAFIIAAAGIFLRLALAWRKAVPFGRPTIIGLRWLGLLLIIQFFVEWAVDIFVPRSDLSEIFFFTELYDSTVVMIAHSGPVLSSGILFLILSWVLDYGHRIKEEQALTI